MADVHISLPCVRLTLSRFARKHKVNYTVQAQASIQRIESLFLFSVHKMVADALPDVTSPTFLTYFSLHASGPFNTVQEL